MLLVADSIDFQAIVKSINSGTRGVALNGFILIVFPAGNKSCGQNGHQRKRNDSFHNISKKLEITTNDKGMKIAI